MEFLAFKKCDLLKFSKIYKTHTMFVCLQRWYSIEQKSMQINPRHHYTVHRGAFCQFPFRWIYYCHSSKFTRKETGKTHSCAVVDLSTKIQFR